MPELSRFLGIVIAMFVKEHNPPHFHAYYNEFEVQIEIESGKIMQGYLPRRSLNLVQDWRELHIKELMHNWEVGRKTGQFTKIEPLE